MANWDDLKQTFFEETKEGLEAIDAGLTDIRDGAESEDTVNAVFRAIHSVKGGAGVFGFEDLVRFAHVFETVLDAVRHGALAAAPEVLDVLFSASDVLADLVAMARANQPAPAGYGDEVRVSLEALIGHEGGGEGEDDTPAEDFDIPFVPVRVDDFDVPGADAVGERIFSISFHPKADFLLSQDPLFLLAELRKLGTLELAAETDALPALAELSAGVCYVGWSGTLRTAWTQADVERVFAFVADKCDLAITDLSPPDVGALAGPLPLPEIEAAPEPLPMLQAEPAPTPALDLEPALAPALVPEPEPVAPPPPRPVAAAPSPPAPAGAADKPKETRGP